MYSVFILIWVHFRSNGLYEGKRIGTTIREEEESLRGKGGGEVFHISDNPLSGAELYRRLITD